MEKQWKFEQRASKERKKKNEDEEEVRDLNQHSNLTATRFVRPDSASQKHMEKPWKKADA